MEHQHHGDGHGTRSATDLQRDGPRWRPELGPSQSTTLTSAPGCGPRCYTTWSIVEDI
ncbi:hypothetical protein C8Q76DRAFT_745483 [Earliella scabrosa]|nr:hypothetical protein C8Q76DRAFT_745483 [Earliella scabrosa]